MFEKVVLPDEKSGFFPSRSPLFEQVKASIIKKIQQGVWHHDDVLPNEIELAKIFNVSQGTIRRALKELVQEGFLVRKQGKGVATKRSLMLFTQSLFRSSPMIQLRNGRPMST